MQNFRGFLLDKYRKYQARNLSAADFVQAAGNIGVKSCPGGPTVKTVSSNLYKENIQTIDFETQVIGRRDSSIAPPQGTLPFAFGPGSDYNSLIKLWQEKGINPRELAALMGAHSVSRSFTRQENGIPSGGKFALYLSRTIPWIIADVEQDRKTPRHEHGTRSTSPRLKQSKRLAVSTDSTRTSTLPIPIRPAAKHLPNSQTTEVGSNKQHDGASKDANVECAQPLGPKLSRTLCTS